MNSSGSIHISENASIWLAVNRSMPSQPRCGRAAESKSAPAGWKTSGSHNSSRNGRRSFASPLRYRIADPSVLELCDQVCSGIEAQLGELGALISGGA